MRISELSSIAGVPVATIKYYLREGLLPEGQRTSPTQADYGDAHVRRLRVIRALVDAGVSIADTRRVLATLDDPPAQAHDLLGAAHAAVAPRIADVGDMDLAAARDLIRRMGGDGGACDANAPAAVAVARALRTIEQAGFRIPPTVMDTYLDAAQRTARAELAATPTSSAEEAVRYVVLGSVLAEPLLLALRRVAQQLASAERFDPRDGGAL